MSKWSVIIPPGCSGTCRRIGLRLHIGNFNEVAVVDVYTVRCNAGERLVQDLAGVLIATLNVTGVIAHIDTDSKRRVLLPMQPFVVGDDGNAKLDS